MSEITQTFFFFFMEIVICRALENNVTALGTRGRGAPGGTSNFLCFFFL